MTVTVDVPAIAPRAAGPAFPSGFRRRLVWQLGTEFGPLLTFFVVFLASDLAPATAAYAAAVAVAFAVSWVRNRRVPVLPSLSVGLVLAFCGLTLALDDALFVKIQPTVMNLFFAAVIGIGWALGYRVVAMILAPECRLDEAGQRRLTMRTTSYLLALAVLNELVWRTASTDVWVAFKVIVLFGMNILFALSQIPLLRGHMTAERRTARPPVSRRRAGGGR